MIVDFENIQAGLVAHIDDLDLCNPVEGREPQELLFLVAREEQILAILRLQAKLILPGALGMLTYLLIVAH